MKIIYVTQKSCDYAVQSSTEEPAGPLFASLVVEKQGRHQAIMQSCIEDLVPPLALRDRSYRWWHDVKASDEFLDPLFEMYFAKLGLPNLMRKSDYHTLANLVPAELITDEIRQKLDMIKAVAERANPEK